VRLIAFRRAASTTRLYLAEDFADIRECGQLTELAERVAADPAQESTAKVDATGLSFEMPIDATPVLGALTARMETAFGFRNRCGGAFRYRRYRAGESHPLHFDNFEISGNYLVLTAMLWLADPGSGGETFFPFSSPAPLLLHPRRGRLAVWLNYLPDGAIDRSATHEALPVTAGEKITLTNFVYAPIEATPAFARGLHPEAELPGVQFAPHLRNRNHDDLALLCQ
jgi:hypothetical protein